MDNTQTGTLIKELRKEKNLTQKDIADRLNITDRAVSKWERGLCAPDISLLEQLAEILNISTIELIRGERIPKSKNYEEIEINGKKIINYFKNEMAYRTKKIKRRHLLFTAICIVTFTCVAILLLWCVGYFNLLKDYGNSIDANQVRIIDDNYNDESEIALEIRNTLTEILNTRDFLVTISRSTNMVEQSNEDIRVSVTCISQNSENLSIVELQAIINAVQHAIPNIKYENIFITDSSHNIYDLHEIISDNN